MIIPASWRGFSFLVSVGTLFAILGFLSGRTAAMSPSDILFLLGFGLHLAVILRLITSTSEVDAVLEDMLEIVHDYFSLQFTVYGLQLITLLVDILLDGL